MNANVTKRFFSVTDAAVRADVLKNIAAHYGISTDEALAEVTDDEAESLLDYVTGPMRAGVLALYRRHSLPI